MLIDLCDGHTFAIISRAIDLRDCFPDADDPEYFAALNELQATGRYWTGGGAAPLFYMTRATNE
jgi:hypothetical protein